MHLWFSGLVGGTGVNYYAEIYWCSWLLTEKFIQTLVVVGSSWVAVVVRGLFRPNNLVY